MQRGPQKCLNGTDSEQLNRTRTTHRPGDHNTPHRHKLGKHEWHTVGLSGRPLSALQPTPRTHSAVLRRRTPAHVCILYFRSPAPICSDAHQCLLEHGVNFFFPPCTSVFSAVLASLCALLYLLSPWPPLAVGCSADNHQAARVCTDTHQRLRPKRSQLEICSSVCQESLCCQG